MSFDSLTLSLFLYLYIGSTVDLASKSDLQRKLHQHKATLLYSAIGTESSNGQYSYYHVG